MIRFIALTLGIASLAQAAAPAYDFFICANINRDYVIGSTITTTNGLFQRDEATGEWRHFGYNDTSITALAFDPRDRNVIYTTTLNGLWRSLDGGETWKITTSWDVTEARDVAVDPNAPDTLYMGVPSGLVVSTDRAETWTRREKGLPDRGKYTQTVEVDRTKAGRVFAGTEKGIFLTENAGKSWRQVQPADETVNDIQQSPHDPKWWAAVSDKNGAWQSRDGGKTWKPFAVLPNDQPIYNITFDSTNASRLAIASWAHGVWTSEDAGATWQPRNAGLPENPRGWRVGVDPNTGRLYASIFKETLYYSDDFGRTWHADALAGSAVNNFVSVPHLSR